MRSKSGFLIGYEKNCGSHVCLFLQQSQERDQYEKRDKTQIKLLTWKSQSQILQVNIQGFHKQLPVHIYEGEHKLLGFKDRRQ